MATKAERLDMIRNRTTAYELTISRGDVSYLVGYTRKGQRGLWLAITNEYRVKKIVALTGTETVTMAKRAQDGATMGEWAIRFTGRTQRDAIMSDDELPRVSEITTP